MLKHRLLFGTLMVIIFVGVVLLDGFLDGSISFSRPNNPMQAPLFTLFLVLLAIPTQFEFGKLMQKTGAVLFKSVTIIASILLATVFFWGNLSSQPDFFMMSYLLVVPAISFLALILVQAIKFGAEGTLRNVGGSLFSIIYLGFLCGFLLGIRILWGPWVLLLFVFTVKSSDIGAYMIGRWIGRHTMAPSISPGKTWEGLGGAVLLGALVAVGFCAAFDIIGMEILPAAVFGAVFGVLGQLGDLAESMIKRDAASKDSSAGIPGFGGLLDVIDSPLATAPAAFLFFYFMM